MNVFIFLGPTLAVAEAQAELDAIYLPPVAQGDVYRVAKERPFAIGIIDGYFEQLPSVWHKEILWALTQRIHVFGASSMGALRAAELARFGMQGVGEIYRAFAAGELEDDDEVAVAHGDADTGHRATSEAMVNIRATLAKAERSGALSTKLRLKLEEIAKSTFYPERSFPQLLAQALAEGLPKTELEAVREFVATERVDQKRIDAFALLHAIRASCSIGAAPKAPAFPFQHTDAWDQVMAWAETQPPLAQRSGVSAELLAAEVRLLGPPGKVFLAAGLNRVVAGVLSRRRGVANVDDRVATVDRAWRRRVLSTPEGHASDARFRGWLLEQGLTSETYQEWIEREAQLEWLKERYRADLERNVVDELRKSGDFARLARRAEDKERVLLKHGVTAPTLQDAGLSASELLGWYFAQRTNHPVPSDLDEFLTDTGLSSAAALQHEALREFMYVKLSGDGRAVIEDLTHEVRANATHGE